MAPTDWHAELKKAQDHLTDLQRQRDELDAHIKKIREQKAPYAHAAYGQDDADAHAELKRLNREITAHSEEKEDLNTAIEQAQQKLTEVQKRFKSSNVQKSCVKRRNW